MAAVTSEQRRAKKNQVQLAKGNAQGVRDQLESQLATYDFANRQNRKLADVQLKQNSRKNEADRFEAQRDLQNTALSLLGSMGTGPMNSSSLGNLMSMLENRNDKENNTYWAQLLSNNDQVENTYNDSYNQNNVAKRDAITSAQKAIADIEGDLSANLNNINPKLFSPPGKGAADLNSGDISRNNRVKQHNAQLSGYVTPDNNRPATRNRMQGGDYFSQLMNSFNGR